MVLEFILTFSSFIWVVQIIQFVSLLMVRESLLTCLPVQIGQEIDCVDVGDVGANHLILHEVLLLHEGSPAVHIYRVLRLHQFALAGRLIIHSAARREAAQGRPSRHRRAVGAQAAIFGRKHLHTLRS